MWGDKNPLVPDLAKVSFFTAPLHSKAEIRGSSRVVESTKIKTLEGFACIISPKSSKSPGEFPWLPDLRK